MWTPSARTSYEAALLRATRDLQSAQQRAVDAGDEGAVEYLADTVFTVVSLRNSSLDGRKTPRIKSSQPLEGRP